MTADASSSTNRLLTGKVAIVTGGASGIGRATWKHLMERGAEILVTDVSSLSRQDTQELGARNRFALLDVRDREKWHAVIAETVSHFGRLDILVNAAGILHEGSLENTTPEALENIFDINVAGTFWACQAVIPAMAQSGNGSIVNIASISGLSGDANLFAYSISKGAIRSLTKDIATYCTRNNLAIRCNSVHPGVIDTPMLDSFFAKARSVTPEDWIATQPIGRAISADEVAQMIVWLCSDAARYVTGAEYIIDGGSTA